MPHPLRFESQKGRICVAWVWNREGIEKLVNGKQHSVWFVPTGMKGLPQNVLLNFRLEFPKSDLTIYLPSGISEIFRQMVSTPNVLNFHSCSAGESLRALTVLIDVWHVNSGSPLSFPVCSSLLRRGLFVFPRAFYFFDYWYFDGDTQQEPLRRREGLF